jgi:hypothetical protein
MAVDTYPVTVIGVDPGATTGIAEYIVRDNGAEQTYVGQWTDPDAVAQDLIVRAKASKYPVVFVVERFDNRPGVVNPDFTPKFVIRDIKRWVEPAYTVVWQTPSQAKNLVKPPHVGKPDGLKRFGYYVVGKRHANDASRHVIVFLVEQLKHMPTILKGWPKRG